MSSRVQILNVTMHQSDLTLYKDLNMQTDAIICNQADRNEIIEETINGHNVKMITTTTRGIGKNRMIGLAHATGEFILFSDDDIKYVDGYEQIIIDAFEKNPKADGLIFSINKDNIIKDGIKLHLYNSMKYGAPKLVLKREKLEKISITFNELFGCSKYAGGEDSIFYAKCIQAGLNIYSASPLICQLMENRPSTWFNGCDDKFYMNKGAMFAAATKHSSLFIFLFAVKHCLSNHDIKFFKLWKLMRMGAKEFKSI